MGYETLLEQIKAVCAWNSLTTFPQCILHWIFQKHSVKIVYAIID